MKLAPTETELVGQWIVKAKVIEGDIVEIRINWLIEYALKKVAEGNWSALYRDPGDNRFWELTYPQGQMQGGGPKRLATVSEDYANARYDLS